MQSDGYNCLVCDFHPWARQIRAGYQAYSTVDTKLVSIIAHLELEDGGLIFLFSEYS